MFVQNFGHKKFPGKIFSKNSREKYSQKISGRKFPGTGINRNLSKKSGKIYGLSHYSSPQNPPATVGDPCLRPALDQ
jgi:hypothetical protein